MKTLIKAGLLSLAFTLLYGVRGSFAQTRTPVDGLVARIAPDYADKIEFETIPAANGFDVFELESDGQKLVIRGNNYNSMATGLNHYLKYYCHSFVSWYKDDAIAYPPDMPVVPQKVRKTARVKKRFFLNYCTFSYTMPWWKWQDWERLIDWMALNGINMPLAITGQEAIWLKVWKQYGLKDEEI
ncbi:MAG: alpha-N-acetylglucosaminidase, partial [Sphingobacteriales bacterium]